MSFTTILNMPLLTPGLAGHIPHNEALIILDAIVGGSVIEYKLDTAPASPANGDMYVIDSSVTSGDLWEGHEDNIAIWYENAWHYVTPATGLRVFILATVPFWAYYSSSTWSAVGALLSGRKSGGNQTFTAGAGFSQITWQTEIVGDSDDNIAKIYTHPYSSDDGRIRILEAGIYRIECTVGIQGSGSGTVNIGLGVNSTAAVQDGSSRSFDSFVSGHDGEVSFSVDISLSANTDVYFLASAVTANQTIIDEKSFYRITKLA